MIFRLFLFLFLLPITAYAKINTIYFSGACAAGVVVGGKVPVVITSRSDEAQARLASIAAAVVALD